MLVAVRVEEYGGMLLKDFERMPLLGENFSQSEPGYVKHTFSWRRGCGLIEDSRLKDKDRVVAPI